MYGVDEIKLAKGIHIAHINIRSITNKWEIFKTQFVDSNLHVLGLSETWLNGKLPNELYRLSQHYTLIRNDRNWRDEGQKEIKKGGGVALYVANTLSFSDIDFSHMNISNKDIEIQWISIQLPNSKTIVVGNIYRPPQGNMENFTQVLENALLNIDLSKNEIYLMGDLNVDMLDKKNSSTKKLIDCTKPFGLRQLIKTPTRYSENKNSILDVIFTNSDFICNTGVCDVHLSDHQMVLTTRKKEKIKKQKCNFTGRNYKNYNKDIFQVEVQNADWTAYDNETTVTGKWTELLNIVNTIIDIMCPIKVYRVKQEKEKWITPALLVLIKDKDHALKLAKKRNDPELWKVAKTIRNRCTKRLRQARADFIKENLDNNMGNSKKFWKNIQEVLPNKKLKSNNTINLFDGEKNEIVDPNHVANYINTFFTGIGPKLQMFWNGGTSRTRVKQSP